MTKSTVPAERLKQIASGNAFTCTQDDESASMAAELLAVRGAQPVASRAHFESLCNQFWNWQEHDEITQGEEEPCLRWNGENYTHRVTAALWRMYQAAQPAPAVPAGFKLVPIDLTAENGAKASLIGEFTEIKYINCPECFGDDECESCDGSGRIKVEVPVTWTTIKAIWKKGIEHFDSLAAAPTPTKAVNNGNG